MNVYINALLISLALSTVNAHAGGFGTSDSNETSGTSKRVPVKVSEHGIFFAEDAKNLLEQHNKNGTILTSKGEYKWSGGSTLDQIQGDDTSWLRNVSHTHNLGQLTYTIMAPDDKPCPIFDLEHPELSNGGGYYERARVYLEKVTEQPLSSEKTIDTSGQSAASSHTVSSNTNSWWEAVKEIRYDK